MQKHTIVVTLQTEGDLSLDEIAAIMGNLKEHVEYERAAGVSGFARVVAVDVSLTSGEPASE